MSNVIELNKDDKEVKSGNCYTDMSKALDKLEEVVLAGDITGIYEARSLVQDVLFKSILDTIDKMSKYS